MNLKRRSFVALVLAVPILLLSSPMGPVLPITLSARPDWLVAAPATVLFVYGGWSALMRRGGRGAQPQARYDDASVARWHHHGLRLQQVCKRSLWAAPRTTAAMHMDFWNCHTLIVIMLLATGSRWSRHGRQGRPRRWLNYAGAAHGSRLDGSSFADAACEARWAKPPAGGGGEGARRRRGDGRLSRPSTRRLSRREARAVEVYSEGVAHGAPQAAVNGGRHAS